MITLTPLSLPIWEHSRLLPFLVMSTTLTSKSEKLLLHERNGGIGRQSVKVVKHVSCWHMWAESSKSLPNTKQYIFKLGFTRGALQGLPCRSHTMSTPVSQCLEGPRRGMNSSATQVLSYRAANAHPGTSTVDRTRILPIIMCALV